MRFLLTTVTFFEYQAVLVKTVLFQYIFYSVYLQCMLMQNKTTLVVDTSNADYRVWQ